MKKLNHTYSKLAKEKGFKRPTFFYYSENQDLIPCFNDGNGTLINTTDSDCVNAPTYGEFCDWLREEHNINLYAYIPNITGYWAHSYENKAKYTTYDEAMESGIIYILLNKL